MNGDNRLPEDPLTTDANAVPQSALPEPNTSAFIPLMPGAGDLNGFIPTMDASFGNMALPLNGVQPGMLPTAQTGTISADEIALYDRQIRLWGMQVQQRLRQANVLLIGMRGLGNEIAKNLVLAGIGTLTILDHGLVTEEDLGAQFLITSAHIGQNRAEAALPELQKLNPRVELYTDPDDIKEKLPEYFHSFDITIATGLTMDVLCNINMACRGYGRKFYAADTHGMYGFIFADLCVHDFMVEKPRSNKPTKIGDMETPTRCVIAVDSKKEGDTITDIVTYQETYTPLQLANLSPLPARSRNTRRSKMRVTPLLSCLRALFDFQSQSGGHLPVIQRPADLAMFTRLSNQKHLELELLPETLRADFLRSFLQNLGAELSPVVAFLGGYLAQDVINVLGQKEAPLQNFLLFDGDDFTAAQYSLHAINDDAMAMMNTNGAPILPGPVLVDGAVAVD
ncbi:ubiquitin-like 1-activating enzyme E1 A [Capronia coronata CBS 617.96]|uniref:Ubiquitin-like 1-activating enzyme E1A n=1 Tax=Capronia coronata CBS 617.96 TaxID=1182541 RepID=W9Z9X5_9EURO|nr:ubiquitin-like 1-activating enzyme E1 A [Capronia coronata CBS 617.96]EXJ91319.1 ubiquitin-like 1-activating enzyme E1 A [Capronia coronata CBS 617.96]